MEKQINQTVWFCDVCGRQGSYHGKCEICGKEHCWLCEYIGYNPTRINICKAHQEDEDMKLIIHSFSKQIKKLDKRILDSIIKHNKRKK